MLDVPPYSLARSARTYGPLLAILCVGAFLRIHQLGTESLWFDEWISMEFANLGDSSQIIEQSKTDNNFPTNYLILHYWVWLFGDSEFSLRFPSALAGILAVLAMYKVGGLLFGRATALMASLILALSPFHIYYSQEARPYELAALFSLLSFYFFLKVLKERALTAQVGYVLCTSAFLYLHVYSLFAVLAQNVYVATLLLARRTFGPRGKDRSGSGGQEHGARAGSGKDDYRLGLGRWTMLQAFLFALYIPGLVLLVGWVFDPLSQSRRGWIQPPTLDSVYAVFVNYSGNSPQILAFLLSFSLLAVVGLARNGADKLYLLLLWFLFPVALPVAISIFYSPIFALPYAIAATPALYLLAAKGVQVASGIISKTFSSGRIPRAWKAGTVWLSMATVLIMLVLPEVRAYFNNSQKVQWREATQYVNTHARPGDLVLLYPDLDQRLFDYYSEGNVRTGVEQEPVPFLHNHTDMAQEPVPSIVSDIRNHKRVWAVDDQGTFPNELFPDEFFEGSHTLVKRRSFSGIKVTLYKKIRQEG